MDVLDNNSYDNGPNQLLLVNITNTAYFGSSSPSDYLISRCLIEEVRVPWPQDFLADSDYNFMDDDGGSNDDSNIRSRD